MKHVVVAVIQHRFQVRSVQLHNGLTDTWANYYCSLLLACVLAGVSLAAVSFCHPVVFLFLYYHVHRIFQSNLTWFY